MSEIAVAWRKSRSRLKSAFIRWIAVHIRYRAIVMLEWAMRIDGEFTRVILGDPRQLEGLFMNIHCRHCNAETEHTHWYDAAHGIAATHMAGSERFVCESCALATYAKDPQASRFNFMLDEPQLGRAGGASA